MTRLTLMVANVMLLEYVTVNLQHKPALTPIYSKHSTAYKVV